MPWGSRTIVSNVRRALSFTSRTLLSITSLPSTWTAADLTSLQRVEILIDSTLILSNPCCLFCLLKKHSIGKVSYTSASLASVTIAGAIRASTKLSETLEIIELNKEAVAHLTLGFWLTTPENTRERYRSFEKFRVTGFVLEILRDIYRPTIPTERVPAVSPDCRISQPRF